MRTINKKTQPGCKDKTFSDKSVNIRVIKRNEKKRFDELLGKYHYLGETRPVGDTMRMVAEIDGEWVGLLMWGSAAYRLKDRDEYIGWTATQRAQRQKLVVQNRRFLLLGAKGEHPNRASRILGAVNKALPSLWIEAFGYEPLMCETFTDIEAYAGTCYKASGWVKLGKTKGYSRHRADFYVRNDRPKRLWVRDLRKNAAEILRSQNLPEECRNGAQSDADGVMPLKMMQVESLHQALNKVPDPRASNRSFQIGSILTIVAMALFSGHRNLVQILRFANRLHNNQRAAIGLPRFSDDSSYRKIPSYKVFYNLLGKLDLDSFALCLSQWLSEHSGNLPTALALDGKFIRDTVGLVCMVDHESGIPRAMSKASKKEGEGHDCEIKAAQRMIESQEDLTNTMITADALHCQTHTAREIVARGGDFLVQAKDNQKTVHKSVIKKTKNLSPLLPKQKKVTGEQTTEI